MQPILTFVYDFGKMMHVGTSRGSRVEDRDRLQPPDRRVGNGADSACAPGHTHRLYEAIPHSDKEIHEIAGASHYYMGQREELVQCVEIYSRWLRAHGLDG